MMTSACHHVDEFSDYENNVRKTLHAMVKDILLRTCIMHVLGMFGISSMHAIYSIIG